MKTVAFFLVALTAGLAFISPVPTLAAQTSQPLCPPGQFGSLCNLHVSKAGGIVGSVIQLLFVFAILASLFFLIWGGIRWISSGGDKGKIDQARGTITAAIVGLLISLLAFFIINIVLMVLTGHGISSLSIPKLTQ